MKMLSKLFLLLLIGIISCYALIAKAQPLDGTKTPCADTQEELIKTIETSTVICRRFQDVPEKAVDQIFLYKRNQNKVVELVIGMLVYNNGLKLTTIVEKNENKPELPNIAAFLIPKRTFGNWVQGDNNPKLLNKYINYVNLMLDTLEEKPFDQPFP
ncbi:hypothetical protein H6G64_08505 [Calothrix sp. FACHB-156]|nr:hypothetical protein [Calothrix sp. FACHB-156]